MMGEARRRGTYEERRKAAVKRDLEAVLEVKREIAGNPKRCLSRKAISLLALAEAMGLYTVFKEEEKL